MRRRHTVTDIIITRHISGADVETDNTGHRDELEYTAEYRTRDKRYGDTTAKHVTEVTPEHPPVTTSHHRSASTCIIAHLRTHEVKFRTLRITNSPYWLACACSRTQRQADRTSGHAIDNQTLAGDLTVSTSLLNV